ncbi:MAG TPA: MarR family transcriptional regulator [Parvibaculum sp.]|jgi:DNA-binding MarR family transcriptional regulator
MNAPLRSPPKPGWNIGFLISDASRMLRRIFNERVTPMGLTQAQWRALVHLSRNEGLNQVSLSELLEVQPITVARLIDKLVAAGLVERRPDPNDRRAQRLFLTAQAAPVLDHIWEIADETYSVVLAGFSAAERETLLDLLTRMRANTTTLMPGCTPARSAAYGLESQSANDTKIEARTK